MDRPPASGIRQQVNGRLRLVGALLTVQSFGFGCASLVTSIYLLFTLLAMVVSGWQYLIFAGAFLALAIVLSAVAAGLWILARKLRSGLNRWTLGALALELVFTPIGSILFNLESQPRPTEGPFADGGNGAIGLLGAVMAGAGAIALAVLVFELVISIWQRWARMTAPI
jgi:hypothetical protein